MPNEKQKSGQSGKPEFIAGGSALTGLAALIGASCCVLPLVLVNIGVSAALVGKLAFFARAQRYFLGAAALLLLAAFIASFWNGRRPGMRVSLALSAATIFVLAAYLMPFYEAQLLRWVGLQ